MHIAYNFRQKGVLFCVKITCDGGTILEDGTKVDSLENSAKFFDPSKLHVYVQAQPMQKGDGIL